LAAWGDSTMIDFWRLGLLIFDGARIFSNRTSAKRVLTGLASKKNLQTASKTAKTLFRKQSKTGGKSARRGFAFT
jgi:hypothetical protein